ncbi:hypothetical protein DGN07_23080 [Xanthomonas citri pv. fuscans]|uniref:Uncharacterized protein n=1 Tax=Xanthomonas citri pv. phaseoli var. fuscans TaxID=473423 RepID=A0A808FE98_XANCI|nr:hypothetical protein DGN07_23080 [Xanthomonas citri pv. fuscans]
MPNLERDEVVDERWKRRFIRQLHVFTKEIGFCESFLHVCRLNPLTRPPLRNRAERRGDPAKACIAQYTGAHAGWVIDGNTARMTF